VSHVDFSNISNIPRRSVVLIEQRGVPAVLVSNNIPFANL